MEMELSGFVTVAYNIRGADEEFALTFDAEEFSSPDSDGGFDNSSGEMVYRGVWNGSEENVLVQLTFTATRDGITERSWTISAFGDEVLIDPRVADDRISAKFIEG